MAGGVETVDGVFRALADPTRRRVLARLAKRPASMTELAKPFDMALPSFLGHMRMLERSGLVRSEKSGRVRTYRLAPKRLKVAEDWLAAQRASWESRLDRLDAFLLETKDDPT
jgi:DNA-binding transcriptional ArsR family regulator